MRKHHAWEQYLATIINDRSHGGLLLCDIWPQEAQTDDHFNRADRIFQVPCFTHPNNQGLYQSTLMDWFRFWGYGLSAQTPGELGRSITWLKIHSPTLDSRHWLSTLKMISDAVDYLDSSGVILTSSLPFIRVVRRPRYPKVVHGLLFDKNTRWTEVSSGRLGLHVAESNGVKLMNCAHPRDEVPPAHATLAAAVMNEWLGEVLDMYRSKQSGQQAMHLDITRPDVKKVWSRTLHVANNKAGHS